MPSSLMHAKRLLGHAARLRDRDDYDEQLNESLDEDMRATREMMLMEPGPDAPSDTGQK